MNRLRGAKGAGATFKTALTALLRAQGSRATAGGWNAKTAGWAERGTGGGGVSEGRGCEVFNSPVNDGVPSC